MSAQIHVRIDEPVGWLIIDNPSRKNAITLDMWRSIPSAVGDLDQRSEVRSIVIRGVGDQCFASGADISEFESTRFGPAAVEYQAANDAAFDAVAACATPTIAMIHGPCLGGGLALALSADLRYCDPAARFTIPAAKLGIGYPADGVEQLRRIVGPAVAKEILFTAEIVDAQRAAQWGLVNAVVPAEQLEVHVHELVERIGANAPLSQRAAKLAIDGAPADVVDAAIDACAQSEDYREGVRAFLEKRAPEFQGR